jgi:hypothetical protein
MVEAVFRGCYVKALIDIGNPDAPKGSEPWCRSFHQTICRLKRQGQFAVSNLKYSLRDFRGGRHFTKLTDAEGSPFKSWDNFVEYREPYGLGMSPEVVREIINERNDSKLLRDVLGKRGQYGKGRPKDLALQGLKYGTKAHWLARLDRDGHAELAAKVRAGTMSANAAAIKAKYRKRPKALERILKLLPELTPTERQQLHQQLLAMLKLKGNAA